MFIFQNLNCFCLFLRRVPASRRKNSEKSNDFEQNLSRFFDAGIRHLQVTAKL
jgi:hypothetical protein